MALTFNGGTSGLARAGNIVATYPFTIFAWTRATAVQAGFVAELAADPTFNGGHAGHGAYSSGSTMQAWSSTGGAAAAAASPRAVTVGDWVPCMVVFTAANLRKVYYGSGAMTSNTSFAQMSLASLNAFSVGKQAVRAANYWKGDLACVGIWSSELSAADFAALSAGAVPSTVGAASLVDYWSLLTQAPTQIGVKGRVLVATDTTQAATHPIPETVPDTTPPTMNGALSVSSLTGTGYVLSWPAASDNVAVTAYELSLNGGSTYAAIGNVLTTTVSGRAPGSTDAVRLRARDAAGNVAATPLALSVALPDTVPPTLTGSITVSGLAPTGYTLTWPSASDNVAVTAYEVSLNGGSTYASVGNVLTTTVSGRTPSTTDAVRVRARDAAGNVSTPPLAATVSLPAAPDTTPPVLTGSLTVTGLTSTGYALSWPAGTDNVAVTAYDGSLDGGVTWATIGNVTSYTVTGRTPGTTDQVRVRARDAAGNASSPPLATSVSLPGTSGGMLVTPPLKNNAGTLLANLTGITVNVYDAASGTLVVRKTGLSSSATGTVTISDGTLLKGNSYAYEVVTPAHGRRLPTGVAS